MILELLAFEEVVRTRGGWANQTLVHPVGLAMLAAASVAVLALPRRLTVIPFFILMCVVARQRVSIVSMDWDFIRILIVVGWLRVLMKKEIAGFQMHLLDKAMIAWSVAASFGYILQQASFDAAVLRAGATVDTLGAYFLFRILIQTLDDVRSFIKGAAVVAVPIAVFFLIEKSTGRNLFSVFGGVREFTKVREGRLRCQGAFAHPILAGSFWASLIPLFATMWFTGRTKILSVIAVAASMLIIFACSSSTPVAAVGMVVIGWGMFVFRSHMNAVRWGIVGGLVGLQLLMQKPVYHLISRIDLVGGSTGWHRYHLLDQFVRRIDEWFLVGTKSTAHWGYGLFDVTNQYVLEGVRGGILALVAFLAVVVIAFRAVGEVVRAPGVSREQLVLGWGIGVAIFTHCMIFFAVSYFGQIVVLWHLVLAIAASAAVAVRQQPRTVVVRQRTGAPSMRRPGRTPGAAVPKPLARVNRVERRA